MTTRVASREATAVVAALLAVVMWGAVPVGTRFLVDGDAQRIAPTLLVALRFGLSALVLLPALLLARPWAWPRPDRRLALVAAGLGVIGYNLPVAIGQVVTSAGVTALVIATEPLWILLLWCLKRRTPPTWPQVGGALAGAAGIAVIATPGIGAADLGRGIAWVFLGAFSWSAYCVVVVPLAQRHGALSVTATTVSLGCLPLLFLAAPTLSQATQLDVSDMAVIAILAIGSTVLATLMWNVAVAHLPGPLSGQFLFGIPVVGIAAGHLLLGETFTSCAWIALACIAFGLWLSQRKPNG